MQADLRDKRKFGKTITQWLRKNNIDLKLQEFLIIIAIIITFPIFIGLLIELNFFICIFFSFASTFIFLLFIRVRRSRENQKKEEQMEQFLMALTARLYNNNSVIKCIEKSIEDTDNPLKQEFEIIINENRRGIILDDCLKNMINRNSSQIIETTILGFIAANDKGVDLISFLNSQIEFIREKRSLKNYIEILSSGPKYTSYFIMAIPLISLLTVTLINNDFIQIIFSGIGLIVLVYAAISYVIGLFLINRIINFSKIRK